MIFVLIALIFSAAIFSVTLLVGLAKLTILALKLLAWSTIFIVILSVSIGGRLIKKYQ